MVPFVKLPEDTPSDPKQLKGTIHMIRKLALSTVFAAIASTSFAADLPGRAPAAAPFVSVPAFTWAGFYAGMDLGYGWSQNRTTDVNGYALPVGNTWNGRNNGIVGNLHAGYNWQFNNIVVGAELSSGYLGLRGAKRSIQPGSPGGDTASSVSGGWLGAATLRAGFAFNPFLIYVKGGAAYFSGTRSVADTCNILPCGPALASGSNGGKAGWTLGAGAEYAINQKWSVRAEYNYFDFGKEGFRFVNLPAFNWSSRLKTQTVTLGLNYKF